MVVEEALAAVVDAVGVVLEEDPGEESLRIKMYVHNYMSLYCVTEHNTCIICFSGFQ